MTKDRLLYYMLDKKKKAFWIPTMTFLAKNNDIMTLLVDKDDKISKLCILSLSQKRKIISTG